MQLYAGPTHHFIQDSLQNAIADKLKNAFVEAYRYRPPDSEIRSWRNSLRSMSQVLQHGELHNTSVVLEYQLPMSSRRLDCMVLGRDKSDAPNAVIVELKQWEKAKVCDVEDCVLTFLGGAEREVLHPSVQVHQYRSYLEDMHTAFRGDEAINLQACAYLHNHNWSQTSPLLDGRYSDSVDRAPLYFGDQATDLTEWLRSKAQCGDDTKLLNRVCSGEMLPSKALMRHVADMIEGNPVYTLLDEQLVVFNTIMAMVQSGYHSASKAVVIINGGPGTGKSVIAANLVAELSRLQYRTFHATGSKAFTTNLRKAVGQRASALFKYFNSFKDSDDGPIDVLICDEAHRIRATSHNRFTPKAKRTNRPQVDELIGASRVSVFFIDDLQVVRPGEVGSAALIREASSRAEARLKEHELEIQFRCRGSEGFINWVDNTLGIRKTANVIWTASEEFDFRIMDSVEQLDALIRKRHQEGHTARLVAGFCWPWSNRLSDDGKLVEDVRIGSWTRPWNARPELTRLPKHIPKSNFWATDPNGIEQVGCVYTAQGFDFDYVGVIIGKDLIYKPAESAWVGRPEKSCDSVLKQAGETFVALVKQTYRVLLTRGMKGCYVTFLDHDTEAFVRSRMETIPVLAVADPGKRSPKSMKPESNIPRLTKNATRLWPDFEELIKNIPEAEHDIETLVGIVNDLTCLLERSDLASWRKDATQEYRLRQSLHRVLHGFIPLLNAEKFIELLIKQARSR